MQNVEPRESRQGGFTYAELAFAMLILVMGAVVLIEHLAVNYRTTATERDRVFAFSKAQSILAEIQGFVDRGQVDAAVDLDVLDDGIVSKNPLTIQTDGGGVLLAADHAVSGNYRRDGQWVWSRRITVQPFAGLDNRNVRYVTVRIYKRSGDGTENPMADLSAVINSAGNAFPTTQVFDVYLFAVENVPGWWVFMDSIKPFVESMITDLENRNPGLTFRTHWITKASFGRNQLYRPYTNEETDSYAVIPDVYHYPGRMPAGNASSYYYVPDNIKARVSVDGLERNGYDATLNPHPYALADFFNHAMRYPEELALWQRRVAEIEDREEEIADAIANGTVPPPELEDMSKEPTLRLFLEDLYSNPAKYRNALLINLHGELLAMPALRNYSDPAREPVNAQHQHVRVVTHPEELRTKREEAGVTDPLLLRMYAWLADPTAAVPNDRMSEPMVVEVVGMNLTDPMDPTRLSASCTLQRLAGGVPVPSFAVWASARDYGWAAAKHSSDALLAGEMYYEAEYVVPGGGREPFTRIYLYNTPVIAPLHQNTVTSQWHGLAATERARLYQMHYVPCPVVQSAGVPSFTARDLTANSSTLPKNTARWSLRIDPDVFANGSFVDNVGTGYTKLDDAMVVVRTRIASGLSGGDDTWKDSGTIWPTPIQPDNLSTTYAWWTDSKEDVPFTERAQFNGDPRHVPYKDCFNGGDDFPNSYNWYHDALTNGGENSAGDYPSINGSLLRNRWQSAMSCDVPRYFELLRTGVVRSACVYTTLTGWSYYYLGIGNDIGYDSANGYPNSIPSNMLPHGGSGNGYINTIIGARRYVRKTGGNYWWGMPWLGELYPDELFAQWIDSSGGTPRGNLLAGTTGNRFYQATCNSVYGGSNRTAYGTSHLDFLQRTAGNGCSTFFNIGTNTSAFRHVSSSGNGSLTVVGQELANNYGLTMPSAAPITRPFGLNQSGGGGDHWLFAPYSTRYTGSLYRTYYTHGSGTGSGLVKLVDPANTNAAYVVVNGISNAVDNGTTFIAKFAVLSLVHSFFEAGSTTNSLRIPQLPRLEIESPTDITELNDPSTIEVRYAIEWTRWDGQPYAQTGTYAEDELQLEYVIMYSIDNGITWRYVQDDSVAKPGQRPSSGIYVVYDFGLGAETYDWAVPSGQFPEGSYLLRIDCFRQGAQVHFAFHQSKLFIQR